MEMIEMNNDIMSIQNIPSIPVQTMDDMLLRKVEKLTLYVIELKKENEEMKSKIENLK